ncbi:hypothetical protein [Actinosynnema sp. NPDC020468]|uniref:hypothetical protein n=1 Tax=Actinosynnema sp. NPDC020468 TaxID=3154488 RepID=UPI0033C8EA38
MDLMTGIAVDEVCARLAGRLSDDVQRTVREHFAAGEWTVGESVLLLSLAREGVGITRAERDLIRFFSADPDAPELARVPEVPAPPTPRFHFRPDGPAHAPDPSRADAVLATGAAELGGRRLSRAWREPLDGGSGDWVHLLEVGDDVNELAVYSSLSSLLWDSSREKGNLEIGTGRWRLYHAAVLAGGRQIWSA